MYKSPATDSSLAPDAALVAQWVSSVAPVYLRLVNDGYDEVEFLEKLPDGSAGSKVGAAHAHYSGNIPPGKWRCLRHKGLPPSSSASSFVAHSTVRHVCLTATHSLLPGQFESLNNRTL